jgi:hypothetical protein
MSSSIEPPPHLRPDYGSIITSEPSESNHESANPRNRRDLWFQAPLMLMLFGLAALVVSVSSMVALFQSSDGPIISPTSTLAMVSTEGESSHSESLTPLEELQDPSTVLHPSSYVSARKYPEISLDFDREREVNNGYSTVEQTSILVSWTMGRVNDHDLLDSERDIIALLCGDNLSHFEEAKSLAEASSRRRRLGGWHYGGSRRNSDWWGGSGVVHEKTWRSSSYYDGWHIVHDSSRESESDGENQWHLDPVPQSILDQKKCQFVIYYKIRDQEYAAVSKSAIIQF